MVELSKPLYVAIQMILYIGICISRDIFVVEKTITKDDVVSYILTSIPLLCVLVAITYFVSL